MGYSKCTGQWIEDLEDVVEVASTYLNVVPNMVTEDMQEVLSSEFTAEEVKMALFQMGPIKAPGPDDMNAFFYQKF